MTQTQPHSKKFITVLADDLTGAAELAGICLRYGLTVRLYLDTQSLQADRDVIIVCTDSRSMTREHAKSKTREALDKLVHLSPGIIYKKIDSVLRGYVLDELHIQMNVLQQSLALIVPANPSLGRTISDGQYLIGGIKINETAFKDDPEFPAKTASVSAILGGDVRSLRKGESLPQSGIFIGDATSQQDVECWAEQLTSGSIAAGAGDFFTAILARELSPATTADAVFHQPIVYVCGTAFAERQHFIRELDEQQKCVAWLPVTIENHWLTQCKTILEDQQKLVIAIRENAGNDTAANLRGRMARAVLLLTNETPVKEIFIEGGSTAAAVLSAMHITSLQPLQEISRGVVRMQAKSFFITMKPGSYQLPHQVLSIFSHN